MCVLPGVGRHTLLSREKRVYANKVDELLPHVCGQSDATDAALIPAQCVCVCVCSGLSEQCDNTQQLYEAQPRTPPISLSLPVSALILYLSLVSVGPTECFYLP